MEIELNPADRGLSRSWSGHNSIQKTLIIPQSVIIRNMAKQTYQRRQILQAQTIRNVKNWKYNGRSWSNKTEHVFAGKLD